MSHNSLWTPTKFTVLSSHLTAVALAHPQLNTARLDYSLFLLQTHMNGPIDIGYIPSLIRRMALEYMPYNPNEYLPLFFSAGPISSSFTAETHPLEYGLVWCNNHKTTFSKSFYKLPIGSFPTFKGPLIFRAKTPLKYLVSCLLTFQPCHCKLPTSSRYPLV